MKQSTITKHHNLVQSQFNEVLDLIESGMTITQTLEHLNININVFYKNITLQQRILLGQSKTLATGYKSTLVFQEYSIIAFSQMSDIIFIFDK